MKKFITTIEVNGKEKRVKVYVDDKTAKCLEECEDKQYVQEYLREEYKIKTADIRETRRHVSLEHLMEEGKEDVLPQTSITEQMIKEKEKRVLHEALKTLTEKQRYVLLAHVLDEKPYRQIGEELGIRKDAVKGHFWDAIKKIKTFFAKVPPQTADFVSISEGVFNLNAKIKNDGGDK